VFHANSVNEFNGDIRKNTMADPVEKKRIDADIPATPVQIHAQYLKDFSFENPNAPESLRPISGKPEMDVNIVLDAIKINDETNPDLYESGLTLTVKSTRDGKVLFISEIVYAALVTIKDIPSQHVRSILYVDVPQMLFPFARQIISNAVTSGGFPPLLLNPIDFRGMYTDAKKKNGSDIAAA
jgi:preprotein translocase subunit SecB